MGTAFVGYLYRPESHTVNPLLVPLSGNESMDSKSTPPPMMPEPDLGFLHTSAHKDPHASGHQDKDRSFWHTPPPAYSPPAPPPSGYRVALTGSAPFPFKEAGTAPCHDVNAHDPVFLGSALFDRSVQPCKIAPHLPIPCRVPFGGLEYEHAGRYDLLPFDHGTMEFVPASHGRIPHGRRPVEGGYEDHGPKLYHAIGVIKGVRVPGKTAEHLGGCNVAFGGGECFTEEYSILCWK